MKKWVIWLIVALIILAIIGGTYYFNSQKSSKTESFNFGDSKDTGQLIGESTDTNAFDDIKLNPFEENE